jgi:hypothetical protein
MSNPYSAPATESEPAKESSEPVHPVAGPPLKPLPIAEGDNLVTVYSTSDAAEADMLSQFLLAEGIPTPIYPRMTGAQIGLGAMAVSHPIRVPQSKEAEARELVELFLEGSPDALPPEAGEEEPIPQPFRPKSNTRAFFVFFVVPVLAIIMFAAILNHYRLF